jgi:uncharacterized membrane protein
MTTVVTLPATTVDAPAVTDNDAVVGAVSRVPMLLLSVAVTGWCLVWWRLVLLRHQRYGSVDFDMGIFSQSLWVSAHGGQFLTVRGLAMFAHHVEPGFWLLAPFSWFGAGPAFLNLLQVAALGAGAFAVEAAARRRLGSRWLSLVLALAYLGHFSLGWLNHELFHPEVLAIAPLLAAYVAGLDRRWGRFALWCLLAIIWKEDVALAVAGLGLFFALKGQRRAGLLTFASGVGWFLISTKVIIPAFNAGGTFYERGFYGPLGSSSTNVLFHIVAHPTSAIRQLNHANAVGYVRDLAAPYAFTPVLAPAAWLIGIPQMMANLLSSYNFTWSTHYHYAALPVLSMTIGMVEGVAFLRRRSLREIAVVAIIGASAFTIVGWGATPVSHQYAQGSWPLVPNLNQRSLDAAVGLIPPGESVAASYNLVPHLAERWEIYSFPTPWHAANWGNNGEGLPDPHRVDFVAVDLGTLGVEDTALLAELRGSGSFETIMDDGHVVVLHRRQPTPPAA